MDVIFNFPFFQVFHIVIFFDMRVSGYEAGFFACSLLDSLATLSTSHVAQPGKSVVATRPTCSPQSKPTILLPQSFLLPWQLDRSTLLYLNTWTFQLIWAGTTMMPWRVHNIRRNFLTRCKSRYRKCDSNVIWIYDYLEKLTRYLSSTIKAARRFQINGSFKL